MKTQQVKPLPDTPAVIVNVFIKEEHHYHKGAVHLDFHDHFMAHLVSKLKSELARTSATALRLGESESPWLRTNQALSHSYLATE